MLIRTKIVATVGPATGEREMLLRLAQAGCDVFRVNLSHGSPDQWQGFLDGIRAVERSRGEPLAVLADLCGPKIRVGSVPDGPVRLEQDARIEIRREPVEGGIDRISTTLPELVDQVAVGDSILLDDGKIKLRVVERDAPRAVCCKVVRAGWLASGKGVNLPDTHLDVSAMTEKDRRDVAWLAGRGFDYVGLSFVQSAEDVSELRRMLTEAACRAHVVAKIEKPQALEHVEAIAAQADAIMIARGDLGVEMDLPRVPMAQKRIARICQTARKPCIVATQMLETMTQSEVPTRAEVSDVANAVLDRTDAVMLSGETAVGSHPVQAVAMMNDIVSGVQAYRDAQPRAERIHDEFLPDAEVPGGTTGALAHAVREVIRAAPVAAVAVYTATGTTARLLAKLRLPVPVLALTPDQTVARRMCLYYGVLARQARAPEHTREVLALAADFARQTNAAREGDRIVVLSGRPIHCAGTTNTLVVHTIGEEQPAE